MASLLLLFWTLLLQIVVDVVLLLDDVLFRSNLPKCHAWAHATPSGPCHATLSSLYVFSGISAHDVHKCTVAIFCRLISTRTTCPCFDAKINVHNSNDSANHNLMQRCTTVLRPCAVVSTSACVASNNSNCSLSKH